LLTIDLTVPTDPEVFLLSSLVTEEPPPIDRLRIPQDLDPSVNHQCQCCHDGVNNSNGVHLAHPGCLCLLLQVCKHCAQQSIAAGIQKCIGCTSPSTRNCSCRRGCTSPNTRNCSCRRGCTIPPPEIVPVVVVAQGPTPVKPVTIIPYFADMKDVNKEPSLIVLCSRPAFSKM
jgi:hypothetical protein